jgi:hypothetical protein
MAETVLITGARAPAALDLARSVKAAGLEPHLADAGPCRMARASTAPRAVHRYAAPRADKARFAADLDALVDQLDPVLIVPACEEVFHLAAAARDRPWRSRLFAPGLAVLDRLHRKSAFAAAASALGLDAPPTSVAADRDALQAYADRSTELVFKPDYSRFGTHALVGPSPHALARLNPAAPLAVQTRIHGEEVSFYAACREGALVAFCAYRSTWRLGGGAGYAFETLERTLTDRLRAIAETVAAGLVGQGQFACDLIVDDADRPWLIECNPRATSGVHLFNRSADLALAMLGRGPVATTSDTCAHLAPALWRYGLPTAMARGRLNAWSQQWRAGVDVIGAPGDAGPILGALHDSLAFGVRALFNGRSLEAEMTADIEWNGEAL